MLADRRMDLIVLFISRHVVSRQQAALKTAGICINAVGRCSVMHMACLSTQRCAVTLIWWLPG
jgi:hypothetical protein